MNESSVARTRHTDGVKGFRKRGLFVVLALFCGLFVACSEDKPLRPRGLLDANGRPVERPSEPVTEKPSAPEEKEDSVPGSLPSPWEATEQAQAAAKAAEEAAKQAERDLNKELEALLGQPSNCLDLEKAAETGRASINVTATVAPSGRITRATVTATGQPASAISCIEQRVLSGALKGPIEDAPLTVSAQTVVEVQKAKPKEQPTQAPAPVVPAATTLAQPDRNSEIAQPDEDTEYAQPAD